MKVNGGERYARLRGFLARRGLPLWAGLLGAGLTLASLGVGWIIDDHWHRLALTERQDAFAPGVLKSGSLLGLFAFMDGDPERNHKLMDLGVLPWWSDEGLRGAFCRPVTAATHWLDYQLWPDHAVWMHVQSVAWYAMLVIAVAILHRRMGGPTWVAGLAAVLYAVDDAHGAPVGFLANRNALVAGVFGVCAIIAHDHRRRGGRRLAGVLGPGLLALCLFAKESGIAVGAYLVAYAALVDRGPIRERVRSLLPYAVVIVAWRWVWTSLGFGTSEGMEFYVDPLVEPLRYLRCALERVPLLLMGQWGFSSDVSMPIQTLFSNAMPWVSVGSALFVLCVAGVVVPKVWHDRVTRFWLAGMAMALAPAAAAYPSDRLLIFPGIGAAAVMARFFATVLDGVRPAARRISHTLTTGVFVFLVARHVVLAPAALAVRSANPMGPRTFMEQFHVNTPMDESVTHQSVVIVTAPVEMMAGQLPAIRAAEGLPVPAHTRILSPSGARVTVTRRDDRTLVLRPDDGYLAWTMDQLFRSPRHPMSAGARVELTGVTITVLTLTADGRPAEAAFRFTVPLEDPSLRWLRWDDPTRTFIPFSPPPIGESVRLNGGAFHPLDGSA